MSGHRPWSELRRKHTNCLHGEGDSCVFCGKAGISDERTSTLPTFERCANATLERVQATYSQRGSEYADSWALENLVTTFTAATLARFGLTLSAEQIRLLQAAALIDVKDSRMGGPFKPDSVIDGLAYRAAWLTLMEEYAG